MPAKKSGKEKSVSKEIKEVNDPRTLTKSDEKRERKTPVRFSIATPKPVTREFVIAKGKGVALGSIPDFVEELNKRKVDDALLMTLHLLAYGRTTKRVRVKTNLRQFSGVKYDDKLDRAKLEQRIQHRPYSAIRGVCALLHLPSGGSTAELVGRLADFLERPTAPEKSTVKKTAAPKKKAAAAKKPAAKKAAPKKKAAEKKPAAKKAEKKAPAKKPAAKKAKTEKKPAEKKPAEKKAAAKKPAAKKTTKAAGKK